MNLNVYITNYKQANFYLQKGLTPLEISKNDYGKIVFIYDKQKSQPFYDEWKKTKP